MHRKPKRKHKILFLGPQGVGKSTLIRRIIGYPFLNVQDIEYTIRDHVLKDWWEYPLTYDDKKSSHKKWQLIEFPDYFQSLNDLRVHLSPYLPLIDVFALVYEAHSQNSYQHILQVQGLVNQMCIEKDLGPKSTVIIGNKADLIPLSLYNFPIHYATTIRCSAKAGHELVDELREIFAKLIIKIIKQESEAREAEEAQSKAQSEECRKQKRRKTPTPKNKLFKHFVWGFWKH